MMTMRRTLISALLLGAAAASLPMTLSAQAARPPAPTLHKPTAGAKAVDDQGFIRRWLLLEPVRRNGSLGDSAVRAAVEPELLSGQAGALPRAGDKVMVRDTPLVWHAVDTDLYNVNLYHFAYALNRPTSNVLFRAVTVVNAPREIPNVRLAIGSNAASIWSLNGSEVIALYNDRQTVIDDGVSKRVTLKKGPNVIRAVVINGGGATDFCARFIDEKGNPVKDLTISLDTGGK